MPELAMFATGFVMSSVPYVKQARAAPVLEKWMRSEHAQAFYFNAYISIVHLKIRQSDLLSIIIVRF